MGRATTLRSALCCGRLTECVYTYMKHTLVNQYAGHIYKLLHTCNDGHIPTLHLYKSHTYTDRQWTVV